MNKKLINSARSLVFEINLSEIQELLASAGIPVLVLKGPHVAATLYDRAEERTYSDLDLLVEPGDYYAAARKLLANGFKLFGIHRRRLASEKADYQLLLCSPRGVAVELHQALADASQFRSDVRGFFARSEEFVFGESQCRGLGTEDLLLHLCLHFGKRHFMTSEKKHLLDIALLLKKRSIAWPVFLERVKRAGCRIITYYCLAAARSQHGNEIPREIMDALSPGPWRRRILDRFLDPAVFPTYRYAREVPGFRGRMVNLLLLDRVSRMVASSGRFAMRTLMNRLLRVGPLRRVWMRGYPLNEWMVDRETNGLKSKSQEPNSK